MRSLPFDSEIQTACCADAGQYMLELQAHPALYSAFLRDRKQRWDSPPLQPAHRCVEHLCALIVRTIEEATRGARVDGAISHEEAKRFHRGELLETNKKEESSEGRGRSSGGGTSSTANNKRRAGASASSTSSNRGSRGASPSPRDGRSASPAAKGQSGGVVAAGSTALGEAPSLVPQPPLGLSPRAGRGSVPASQRQRSIKQ